MGFFIPIPIVHHFLANLKDGRYDGFPTRGSRRRRCSRRRTGASAACRPGARASPSTASRPAAPRESAVKDGDVLLSVEGNAIADDGTITLGDARVTFEHAIDMLQVGDRAHFTVWRGGKELRVEAPARRIARYDRNRNRYGIAPDYVVYAGLVFMKLEVELLKIARARLAAVRQPRPRSGTSCSARPMDPQESRPRGDRADPHPAARGELRRWRSTRRWASSASTARRSARSRT